MLMKNHDLKALFFFTFAALMLSLPVIAAVGIVQGPAGPGDTEILANDVNIVYVSETADNLTSLNATVNMAGYYAGANNSALNIITGDDISAMSDLSAVWRVERINSIYQSPYYSVNLTHDAPNGASSSIRLIASESQQNWSKFDRLMFYAMGNETAGNQWRIRLMNRDPAHGDQWQAETTFSVAGAPLSGDLVKFDEDISTWTNRSIVIHLWLNCYGASNWNSLIFDDFWLYNDDGFTECQLRLINQSDGLVYWNESKPIELADHRPLKQWTFNVSDLALSNGTYILESVIVKDGVNYQGQNTINIGNAPYQAPDPTPAPRVINYAEIVASYLWWFFVSNILVTLPFLAAFLGGLYLGVKGLRGKQGGYLVAWGALLVVIGLMGIIGSTILWTLNYLQPIGFPYNLLISNWGLTA